MRDSFKFHCHNEGKVKILKFAVTGVGNRGGVLSHDDGDYTEKWYRYK
jgi:hypothetical protein